MMSGSGIAFVRALSSIKTRVLSQKSFNIGATSSGVRLFSVTQTKKMKLVQFSYKDDRDVVKAGYMEGDGVVDINKADPTIPLLLVDILKCDLLKKVLKLKEKNPKPEPLSSLDLKAPITKQDKVLCVGLNYNDHCTEQNLKPPEVPMIFSKFPSCLVGPSEAVKLRTEVTDKVDWEVELAVVIGREASFVKSEDAYDYILGYTVAQDLSARDWQKERNGGQFLLGKAMDTFCPIGPCIATKDEVSNPQCLQISCSVNGATKQDSNTCQLIHKIPDVVARLSSVMTLFPGDIILTGTPGGVGVHRNPPEFLKPGDVIESKIECIGVLETKVLKHQRCPDVCK